MKKIRILSIDGGGIRGIIPAVILAHLEERLQKKTNNPNATLTDYFDLIAGTSTGGILTCFYVLPSLEGDTKNSRYFAKEAIDIYSKQGKDIFPYKFMSAIRQLYEEKYSEKSLEKVLKEKFSDIKLSETRKRCLITAYDISERKAVFFTTPEAQKNNGASRDYYMRDIARATSAAPTYFKVANIQSMAGQYSALVDGGLFANNPTMCAFIEIEKELLKENKNAFEEVYVLSLGTGKVREGYPYNKAKGWGLAGWAGPAFNILMSSSAEVVDFHLLQLFKSSGYKDSYIRIEPPLCQASKEMDNVKDENIKELINAGRTYVSNNLEQLEDIADKLIQFA